MNSTPMNTAPGLSAATLTEALDRNATTDRFLTYLAGEDQRRRVSFAELRSAALGVLHFFQDKGMTAGDELVIFTTSNEQFLDGFWACLYGGMVPVPVAVGISDDHRHKLLRIFGQLKRPWVYTDQTQTNRLKDFAREHGLEAEYEQLRRRCLVVEAVQDVSQPGQVRPAAPEDTAFIQFSSGSTSDPKGVVLTHANVLANIRAINSAARFTDQDVALSWMPLTHDMGLIGFHLCMLAGRISHTIMDTRLFSRRPLLWLEEASAQGATLLSSPNFGYKHWLKLCESRGPASLAGLDLSAVRLVFNGAEPISVPLSERFLATLAPQGLAPTAMYPVYGLAEASLAVTFPEPGRPFRSVWVDRRSLTPGTQAEAMAPDQPGAVQFMVLGRAIPDCELRIAGDDDCPLPAGTVGHIQIRGGNVTGGYYGSVAQPFTTDGWLRTGDLGFESQGELVVTGRFKEIIFVNGANYYPQDLEAMVEAESGLELGKIAVAGSRRPGDDADELLVFILHRGSLEEFAPLAERVRRRIATEAALEVSHVVPVRNIPKTTSGKIQRGRLAAAFEAGEFQEALIRLAELAAAGHPAAEGDVTATELAIRQICVSVITDRAVDYDDNLFDLGVSSLALAQIHERIDEAWPGRLDIEDLFGLPTIRDIAAHLDSQAGGPDGAGNG